jgi:hypothetical protein
VGHLDSIIQAHKNLRAAHPGRFTDHDFKAIVAFASLGVPDGAFKKLRPEDYWKIGLLGHEALDELDSLAPEVTGPIVEELRKAPAPFCYFADHHSEAVIRAFYLSLILAQHTDNWKLLLANIDPALQPLADIKRDTLSKSGPKLVALNAEQAQKDLERIEGLLSRDALELLLIEQFKVTSAAGFASVIEKERYSTLVRSLALLLALDNLLSSEPAATEQAKIASILFPEKDLLRPEFVDTRPSLAWAQLKEAYKLARDILKLQDELRTGMRRLGVLKTTQLTFASFRELWNGKRINRLEYYLSWLERLIHSGDFLPRPEDELPSAFPNASTRIRQRIGAIADDVRKQLNELNRRFQELIATRYPSWISTDSDVCLTSQFLRRCLKGNWDPQKEKAVILIFDGMRYDIWDEILRPMLVDRMELMAELPASSLLPSETHITRKAISAGTYPDEFDTKSGEDRLLRDGLAREFGFAGEVEILAPPGAGTGETVRYRAGNLDMYIFELCDKELHRIPMKTLPDGREVPSRPLAFVYQQHLKSIIDTEVMAVVRSLAPKTKVFITADHGFCRVPRERLWVDLAWLNEAEDCSYLNARLRKSLTEVGAPNKVRSNVWEFPVSQLRMPKTENAVDRRTKQSWQKSYATVIFPKTGYALSRPGSHFNPDAYTHGGVSIQELIIPMVASRVVPREEEMLTLDAIAGPQELVEGEDAEFRMRLLRVAPKSAKPTELRVDIEASYSREPDRWPVPRQVLYVPPLGSEVVVRFRPDPEEATAEERQNQMMERLLTITASYSEARRTFRKSQTRRFTVRLNTEQVIRRVPSHLGNILGLTPKSMK